MATKLKSPGLEAIIASIEKQLGFKGVIQRYGDIPKEKGWDTMLSFGYPDVDEASNCGGIARGKVIEIFGPESGGKSFLSLKLIASTQKLGLACCLVDAENSFDAHWAAKHGVDTDNLVKVSAFDDKGKQISAEKILDTVAKLCESGGFGLVVIDSTAALTPQKEIDGSVADQDYALLARAMSKGLRKIVASCGATMTTCVFLNQIRTKMGVVFGNPNTTPGGNALKFYSHQRICVLPGKTIKVQDGDREKPVARRSNVTFVKNKVAAPMGSCTIEIVFDEAAMNPLVALCNVFKDNSLIGMREGMFQIKKDALGEKKNIDTGCAAIVQLADYLVKNDLVKKMIDAYLTKVDNVVPKAVQTVLDKLSDPANVVSPLEGKIISVEDAKTDDKLAAELQSEDKEDGTDFSGESETP